MYLVVSKFYTMSYMVVPKFLSEMYVTSFGTHSNSQ